MTDIVHFGVKGMRWGVRKNRSGSSAKPTPRTPEETAIRRRKIRRRALAVLGAAWAVNYVVSQDARIAYNALAKVAVHHAREKAGAEATRNAFADGHGLTNFETVNLNFNSASNKWE